MPWIDRFGIERGAHLLHRLQQLRQAFEREELALQRHQDRVRCRHRVDGEKIERRRTVDQHIGVVGIRGGVGVQRRDRIAQPERAVARRAQFKFETREIHGRGRDMQPRHRGRHHRVAQRRFADQHVIGRAAAVAAVDAEAGGGVALRIEIDDQHALADRRQRGAEIDRGRGLADPALLIGERQDARMALPRPVRYPVDKFHQLRSCAGAMPWRTDRAARFDRVRRSSHVRRCGWNADVARYSNI